MPTINKTQIEKAIAMYVALHSIQPTCIIYTGCSSIPVEPLMRDMNMRSLLQAYQDVLRCTQADVFVRGFCRVAEHTLIVFSRRGSDAHVELANSPHALVPPLGVARKSQYIDLV